MGNTAVAAAVADASLLATNQIIQKFHPLVIPLVISSSCSLSSFWQKNTLSSLYTMHIGPIPCTVPNSPQYLSPNNCIG